MGAEPQLDLPAPPDTATGRKRDATGASRTKHGPYRAGQRVDVLDTVNKWAEADIVKVDPASRRIKVAYVGWSARWDEWLSWDDERVSPHHSQTYIAGARPRPGQRIEAKDDRGQWLEAEVLEVRDDAAFCHYKGFHRKFDEWLPLEGSRLRPFGSTKPRREVEIDSRDVVARSCDSDDLVEVLGVKGPKLRERQVQGDVFERYRKSLQRRGLRVHRVEGAGNCLCRSVSPRRRLMSGTRQSSRKALSCRHRSGRSVKQSPPDRHEDRPRTPRPDRRTALSPCAHQASPSPCAASAFFEPRPLNSPIRPFGR